MPASHQPIAIFSGGSAANSLAPIFTSLATSKSCSLAYIIPISDNGGSSSELIRVFGGPGIGDVRSRLVRLIPRLSKSSPGWREREGIRSLLSHRLSSNDTSTAREEWNDVVDGTSTLWKDITSAKKELIRSIFNLVNLEIIKRSRPPSSTFDFTSASVGNLFLTGARLFTGSFESAIYLMGSICGINDEDVKVIPSINSNFSHHIAAGLEDGSVIVGQNAISHPSADPIGRDQKIVPKMTSLSSPTGVGVEQQATYDGRRPSAEHYFGDEEGRHHDHNQQDQEEEDANLPGTLPTLRTRNIAFNKNDNEELPAKISRIWYINPYGQEILPPANPRAITAINNASAIIYSIGSLYTSLVPSLILKGVGDAIRKANPIGRSRTRTKILILNGSLDREVGPQPSDPQKVFSALDFVEAVVRAGEQSRGVIWEGGRNIQAVSSEPFLAPTTPLNHASHRQPTRPGLYTIKSESSTTTLASLQPHKLGHLFPTPLPASSAPSRDPSPMPSPTLGSSADQSVSESSIAPTATTSSPKIDPIYNAYITHIIHLPNSPTTPYVDRDLLLRKCGIQTVKVYGRREGEDKNGAMLYDHAALRGAIEAILGRNPDKPITGNHRKNTRSQDMDDDTEEDDEHDKDDDEDMKEEELTRKRTREDERRRLKAGGRRNTVDSY